MSSIGQRCFGAGVRALTRLHGREAVRGKQWRGLSHLCRPMNALTRMRPVSSVKMWSSAAPAGSRLTHTTGDKELVEFLKDEIKLENEGAKSAGKLPKLKGFELTSSEGPNVTLTKKSDNETIVIKLNVNNAVDESIHEEEGGQAEKEPKMICKPSFTVEISKGGDKTLAIQCVFPPEDDIPAAEQGEQYEDLIEIQDFALLEKSQEWTDDVYSLSGGLMDGNLYDLLLKLLEERGIDGELVHQLIEFSTAYEHKKYVSLLEQLQAFASAK